MGGFERTGHLRAPKPFLLDLPPPDVSATLLNTTALPPALTSAGAKQMGFTGNQCGTCFGMRMRISGHCEVCEECGNSSGCS